MLLRLRKYDLNATYVPGHDILLPHTLSRAHLQDSQKNQTEKETEAVNMAAFFSVSEERLNVGQAATQRDNKLHILISTIQKSEGHKTRRTYLWKPIQHELSTWDGLVFGGE